MNVTFYRCGVGNFARSDIFTTSSIFSEFDDSKKSFYVCVFDQRVLNQCRLSILVGIVLFNRPWLGLAMLDSL